MTLTQLEYALAVEEHLSFQRAAEACHVAQPSLSAQLKKLEMDLGVTLFQRSTSSGVQVTDVGRNILEQARLVLAEAKKISDLGANFGREARGSLKLGLIPTIGPFLLPLFMERLKANYPDLHLDIFEDSTKVLIEELHFGRLDAAILSPPQKAPAPLIEKLLYYEPFLVYGCQGHPILEDKEVRLATLSDYAVQLLDETHCMRDQVMSACRQARRQTRGNSLRQGSLQTLITLVESERSFTLIPKLAETILNLKYRRSGLRPVVADTPYRKVSLVFNKNLVRKKLVETLHSEILEALPDSVRSKPGSRAFVVEPSKVHFR